jgi:hypothetical protein
MQNGLNRKMFKMSKKIENASKKEEAKGE